MEDFFIGALGAFGAILFVGSYAVFIKLPSVMAIDVDPLVFQAYKSFVCFATSWLVLLYAPLKFTWWGMVGAGLWTVTGLFTITAVRLAGIGPTQSLWSGLSDLERDALRMPLGLAAYCLTVPMTMNMTATLLQLTAVFVSYIWGAYVFREPIRHHLLSLLALFVMAVGMLGIGWATSGAPNPFYLCRKASKALWRSLEEKRAHGVPKGHDGLHSSLLEDGMRAGARHETPTDGKQNLEANSNFFRGVLCAVVVGFTNGSVMIPLQYANQDVVGVEYLVSFGVGSITMTSLGLAIYFAVLASRGKAFPSFHFSVLGGPALLAGLFWSAGNFCSLYATMYLGMSLGWPLVQYQLLVSGLWAVLYYKELADTMSIITLLVSSVLVVLGAVALCEFGTYV